MFIIDFEQAENLVESLKDKINIYWDGYDICIFEKDHNAYYNNKGIFKNGLYGFERKFSINEEGLYHLDI